MTIIIQIIIIYDTVMKKFSTIIALCLTLLHLSSCYKDDNDIGFDISGIIGKTWEVDLGENYRGEPLFSEFTFYSGRSTRYGAGREERFFDRPIELYDSCPFDWEVRDGNLYLDYADGSYADFYDITSRSNSFDATLEGRWGGRIRVHFVLVGGHAKEEVE